MLMAGLVLSLVFHGSVLLPALVSIMKSDLTARPTLRADFDVEDFRRPDAEPDSIDLGIDESTASTLTWIGFDDYQEHMAALAEVEQAAFQTTPTGAEAAPAAPSQAPVDTPPDNVDARTPVESPPVDPDTEPPTSPDPFEELEAWLEATQQGDGPPVGEPTKPDARAQALQDMLEQLQRMMEDPVETPQPDQAAPPDPSGPPQPRPAGQPGEQSDQESDATSILDVSMEQLTLGRPLAAQGLQIKPRKPVFTMLTLVTAVPANPTAELRFRRDGKPDRVRLLESSGDPRIDESVLNSLYRWRAAGKQLRELEPGQTIPIRIRILLTGSR